MLCPEPIQPRRWRNVCAFWHFATCPTTALVAMFAIVAIALSCCILNANYWSMP